MPKVVHLVRHAQGLHNLPPEEENALKHDPDLTEQGKQDCLVLRDSFPHQESIDLLCASPMRRGIQTAHLVFKPVIDRGLKILALPDAQEGWKDPANTGTEEAQLKAEFGTEYVDWSLVHDGWQSKEGKNASDPASLMARATRLLKWLYERPEQDIAIVGHGYFTHYLTGGVDKDGNQTSKSRCSIRVFSLTWVLAGNWANLETRSYHVVFHDGDEAPHLEELKGARPEDLPN